MTLHSSEQPAQPQKKPERMHGLAHLFAAGRYSCSGLRRLSRESAFRQEALVGAILLALALAFLPFGRAIGFAVLLLVLIAVEALNTAIEVLVDHLSPDWSEFARDAKDLGSLAAACIMVAMGLYLVWAVFF